MVTNSHHGAFVVSGLFRRCIKAMEDITMKKQAKRKIILIDGIKYYDDKPETCHRCTFWKNRKIGCILGRQNCYYLAEAVMTEQEKKGCCIVSTFYKT